MSEPGPGHNRSPFDEAVDQLDGLFIEAQHWVESAATSQAEVDQIAKLMTMVRAIDNSLEKMRIEEKKPHDAAAAAVQAKFKPLAQRCGTILSACKRAIAPWLTAREAEQRAEVLRLHLEAETAQKAASEALRATNAADTENLAEREQAETASDHAFALARAARKAERERAQARTELGRAISLRTIYRAAVTDAQAFARHLWIHHEDHFKEFLHAEAQRLLRSSPHLAAKAPGLTITEEKVPI